jgi:4-amino-4-deoxy-L-arabinose transferase-like glycosyltransferase
MILSPKQRSLLEVMGLFCGSLTLFIWGLNSQEVIGFQSRFYLFALEMWQSGASLFPTIYHHPYPDYTGTSTFLIYILAHLFGGVNKLIAVLPSAIAAAITVVMTYLIGSLHNKCWGLYAVFFLLLTIMFLKSARTISLDMYSTMITACCFYLIHSADINYKPRRAWWIYPLLIVSFAFRGPIGLVIPAGVVCTYYLLNLQIKRTLVAGLFSLFLLIICTAFLLALAYHAGGLVLMHDVLHMQVIGRIDNYYLPVYFYFTNSIGNYALGLCITWLVMFGVGYYSLIRWQRVPEMKFLLELLGWILVIVMGMSIPDDKKIRYILPMVPAVALIAAYPFATTTKEKYFTSLRWLLSRMILYFPSIFLLATEAIYFYAKDKNIAFGIHYLSLAIFLIVMQVISFWIFYGDTWRLAARDRITMFIAAISFVVIYIAIVEPAELYADRAHDFVVALEAERAKTNASLVFYKEKPDGLPIKYIINMPHVEQPTFIDNQDELIRFSKPAFFVTSESYFIELPDAIATKFAILANDTLGHIRVVVFTRLPSEYAAKHVRPN